MSNIVNQILASAGRQGTTQKELAEKTGIAEESISRMKHRDPKLDTVERMAAALGYTLGLIKTSPFPRLDNALSVWSSPSRKNDLKLLHARLANASFKDLLVLTELHGIETVELSLDAIKPEIRESRYKLQKDMLNNIKVAYA